MGFQPIDIARLGSLLHLTQQPDVDGIKARLARVFRWNDHRDIDRNNIAICPHKACPGYSLAFNLHGYSSS